MKNVKCSIKGQIILPVFGKPRCVCPGNKIPKDGDVNARGPNR